VGEWVQADLPGSATVAKIGIVNGYGRGSRFFENERVRNAVITFSDGEQQHIQLADHNELQYFAIVPHRTSSVRLTILSVYPGTRWSDAAIGEMRIWTHE